VLDKSTNRPLFYICKTSSTTWANQPVRIDPYTPAVPTCSMKTGGSGTIRGVIPRATAAAWGSSSSGEMRHFAHLHRVIRKGLVLVSDRRIPVS
jgi:hypothetical protein